MRDGFLPGEPEPKPFYKKRAASLAVSLALHALLIYGLYQARMTIKILSFGGKIRNVRLAPPVRMVVPERIEEYITNSPAPGPFEFGTRRQGNRPAATKGEARGAAKKEDVDQGSGLAPENFMKSPPGSAPASGTSLSGSLALGSRPEDEEDGKLRINLLAIPDHVQDAPMGFEGGAPSGRSLRNYVLPGLASSRGGGGRGSGSGTGGSGQRATAVFQSPGYDISPWAAKVMDRVQLNWAIPAAQDVTGRSEVHIAVTIEKDGSFSAFAVTELTGLEVFNAAAEVALKASAPLPALPDDFPASNLLAEFVFAYHD